MKNIFYFILLVCITGCDIPGRLVVNNKTASEARFVIYYSLPNNFQDTDTILPRNHHLFLSCPTCPYENIDTILLDIPANQSKDIFYGFGMFWTNDQVKEYVSYIRRIKIISVRDTTVIKDQGEMYKFLLERRKKRLFKPIIMVKIE